MVAFGTIFSGLSTFSAGIVADSTPKKAYKVNAATTGNVAKLLPSVKLKAGKLSKLKKKTPIIITIAKGNNFNTVVITCILPDSFIPLEFIQVKNQIIPKPMPTFKIGFVFSSGKKMVNAPIIANAIPALLTQHEIQ